MRLLPCRSRLLVGLTLGLVGCGSESTDITTPTTSALSPELVVSNLVTEADTVAFVSLIERTVPHGATAQVSNRRAGFSESAELVNGGLDPIAVPAELSDTITVIALDSLGAEHRFSNMVRRSAPPVVVRSSPSGGSTDSPLLNVVEVIFSEPMDSSTINRNTVRLTLNKSQLLGQVVLDSQGLRAEIRLENPLARRSTYELVVTTEARDGSGERLPKQYSAVFSTANPPPADTTRWAMVSAGGQHTCAQTTDGALYCWGWNRRGQVKQGGALVVPLPLAMAFRDTKVIQAGPYHTCVLTQSGAARCWGGETPPLGALAPYFPSPFRNDSLVRIGSGLAHLCAVRSNRLAECVGDYVFPNGSYLVFYNSGDWTPLYTEFPMQMLSGGNGFDCGLSLGGQAYCQGLNHDGELGDGTYTSDNGPRLRLSDNRDTLYIRFRTVAGNLAFTTLSVGWEHTCGLVGAKAYCWGANSRGQLGIGGSDPNRNVPTVVTGSESYDSVSAGGHHTCALASGRMLCWGDGGFGQFGDGKVYLGPVLAPVPGPDLQFKGVSAGSDHTCGITTDDALYCWGRNDSGQLGDGSLTHSSLPQLVTLTP